MVTIDDGKRRAAKGVWVRTQVRGYSYTHRASLGVFLLTVPATRNMEPPHHLCPGGKTALRIRPAAGDLPGTAGPGTQIPLYEIRLYGRSPQVGKPRPCSVRKSVMCLIPARLRRPFSFSPV